MSEVPHKIRVAAVEDVPFIFSSWLKSYRDAPAVRSVPNSIYYAEHHGIIESIINSPNLVSLVACDPQDESQIFGYLIGENMGEGFVLHWVYVKYPFRRFGVARLLLNAARQAVPGWLQYSHAGKSYDQLTRNKDYIYNPYIILKGQAQ